MRLILVSAEVFLKEGLFRQHADDSIKGMVNKIKKSEIIVES